MKVGYSIHITKASGELYTTTTTTDQIQRDKFLDILLLFVVGMWKTNDKTQYLCKTLSKAVPRKFFSPQLEMAVMNAEIIHKIRNQSSQ